VFLAAVRAAVYGHGLAFRYVDTAPSAGEHTGDIPGLARRARDFGPQGTPQEEDREPDGERDD